MNSNKSVNFHKYTFCVVKQSFSRCKSREIIVNTTIFLIIFEETNMGILVSLFFAYLAY